MNIIDNIERGVIYSNKEINIKIDKKETQIDLLNDQIDKLKNMQNMNRLFSKKTSASKRKSKRRTKRRTKKRTKKRKRLKNQKGGSEFFIKKDKNNKGGEKFSKLIREPEIAGTLAALGTGGIALALGADKEIAAGSGALVGLAGGLGSHYINKRYPRMQQERSEREETRSDESIDLNIDEISRVRGGSPIANFGDISFIPHNLSPSPAPLFDR